MSRGYVAFDWMGAALLMLVSVLQVAGSLTQGQHQPHAGQNGRLKEFLQTYVGRPTEETKTTRYSAALVDLRDDGTEEVIVYLTSDGWCGSGGCTALVLAPQGTSYRVVIRLTITWPPIRVLATKSQGWHDIAVWMQGGGIQPGYEAELSFNGKTYVGRDEPTLRPSKRLTERVLPGQVAIPVNPQSEPLYPQETVPEESPDNKQKATETEVIVPGQSVGRLFLGMKEEELAVSWQPKPDLTITHENACKDTEVVWFDPEYSSPGVTAYVIDNRVFEIESSDQRFVVQGMGTALGVELTALKKAMPDGELLQLENSERNWPSQTDELFWVVPRIGIAFGLNYPLELRKPSGKRIVQTVTIFQPGSKFQAEGCAAPGSPLVPTSEKIE